MITCFLICIVVSLAAGLAIQSYEGLIFKVEVAGYAVEASAVFVVFAVCAVMLLLAALLRLFLACALFSYKFRCRSVAKQYESLGAGYALLSLGRAEDAERIIDTVNKLQGLDRRSLAILEVCAWFRLGKYEMAEKPMSLLGSNCWPDGKFGLWLLESLQREKSRDCRLRVLRRLCDVFNRAVWVTMFRLEIARMEGNWDAVLSEAELAARRGVVLPYEHERIGEIARLMCARSRYKRGEYRASLKLLERTTDMHSAILKSQIHVKLDNLRKARDVLEACYRAAPHPEVVAVYLEIAKDQDLAMERLSSFNAEHYVSLMLTARRYMGAKRYNAAEQYVKRAIAKHKSTELYCMMMDIMACIGNIDGVVYWLEKMRKDSLPDARWKCAKCCAVSPEWVHECPDCGAFDSIQWL
ncbi:hypothetical protein [Anaplasma capra]|uniref:hypothetical protein n=1 Tax=Anaplasma capra TaxID=1562740 RepID=UPI0021D56B03|nr:hypothetical protein [Anaplasma capra]MCU7611114.1 hypothetical protein [Anaplasma capra]MCU7612382.1 hypothetical protein [Anaplasma capra]